MGDPSQLEKMGRELKCPICLSLLNSAVSLTCNHVFCNSCILKSMKSVSNCPVCKVPFRRREVRAAPHMDSLVNIYKSMEAASGFQIFVTQNAPSTKLSGENKQAEDDAICSKQDTSRASQGKMENEISSKRKGAKKTIHSPLEVSDPIAAKPSFPTKKRVQVPQYLTSETQTRHGKLEIGSRENIGNEFKENSLVPRETSISDRKGGPVLSPFFWLRDDEGLEKLSQQADSSQLLEVTPPYVPTFSDIKDSDDGSPSKLSLDEQSGGKTNEADFFDSEMFEWTQRPCSPELVSSPAKMKADGEADGIKKSKEGSPILNLNTNEHSTENEKSLNGGHGITNEDEELPMLSPSRAKSTGRQTASNKSKKRSRTAKEETLKKCLRKYSGQDASFKLKKKSKKPMEEEARDNEIIYLNSKEPTTEKAGSTETVSNVETLPHSSLRAEISKIKNEKMAGGSPGKRQCCNEDLRHKINGNIAGSLRTQCQIGCSASSKKQKLDATDNIMGEIYTVQNRVDENSSPCEVDGKDISDIKQKRQSQKKEVRSALRSKSNKNLGCKKNTKVSFHGISDGPINDQQEGYCSVSAKEIKSIANLSDVFEGIISTDKAEGSFGSRILENSVMLGKPDQSRVALRACQTFSHIIQCAFCLSSEDTKASGEMVRYYNGRPVAVNYNAGLKVIHAHRNCAEWAPNVYFEGDIAINLEAELTRSKRMKCCCCGLKGAALGCYEKSCRKSFHVTCAKMTSQCRWDTDNFVMLCPLHASCKLPNEDLDCQERISKKCTAKRKKIKQSNQDQVVSKHDVNTYPSWSSSGKLGKLVLCCSALTIEEREFVSEFQRASGITVLKNWDLSVTHVIASTDENGACRRTLKVLMGILEGKWILNIEWVKACMKSKKFVQEEQHEIVVDIHGIRNGPLHGRLRILNKQPKIFEGLKFYLMGDFVASYKGYIQDIIVAGGGTILHRKPISEVQGDVSTFIIYSLELPDKCDLSKKDIILNQRKSNADALARATGAKVVNNSWVMNSVAACQLQSFAD